MGLVLMSAYSLAMPLAANRTLISVATSLHITVSDHGFRRVRHHATDANDYGEVTDVCSHPIKNGFGLLALSSLSSRNVVRQGCDFRGHIQQFFSRGVKCAPDILVALKGREANSRKPRRQIGDILIPRLRYLETAAPVMYDCVPRRRLLIIELLRGLDERHRCRPAYRHLRRHIRSRWSNRESA